MQLNKKEQSIFKNIPKDIVVLVVLYIATNFIMFFNQGKFWDDWCLSSQEGIRAICIGTGIPFMIPVHFFLINLTTHPALLYHLLTGIIEIIGIGIFYKCLILLSVSRSHAFFLTLLFVLVPYNSAKMTMACFMYSIGNLFLLFAILFFIFFVYKNQLLIRIISIICFILSFLFLPSTLVMALAFFLLMAVLSLNMAIEFKLIYFKKVLNKLLNWSDFILIPFVFWVARTIFLKPTGIYAAEGYREFSISSVLLSPINLMLAFIQNFVGIGVLSESYSISKTHALLFIAIFIMIYIFIRKYKLAMQLNDKRLLYVGLYFFIAGAFAYIMVGLSISFDTFNSRNQILLRFGAAFLIFYLVSLIHSQKAQKLIITTIISIFIVATISNQLQFQKSWFKQLALEKAFAQEKLLSEGINFVIIDQTNEYNEYKQYYRSYCFAGILYKTFGTQTRFAIDSQELMNLPTMVGKNTLNDFFKDAFYNVKDCKNIGEFKYYLLIKRGSVVLSNIQNIKMLYQYYFDKAKFNSSINNILLLKILPYNIEN